MAQQQPWWKAHKKIEEETFSDWQELRTEDGLAYYFNRVTQETTWDKPAELMTDEEKQSSTAWVWVPDETDVYLPARKLDESSGQVVVELESGEERYVNRKDLISMNKSSLQRIVADLTLLDEMSVPLILHCLRKRFEAAKIYSAVGTILISINPYTQLDLYTPQMIRKYRNSLEEHREVPPHVFVVADQAYKGLTFESGPNQSIVISGESGAGKTEATKQCLSYLGAVAGSVAGVEKKVFDANPILEGFGNAKTLRNNNSSRFGKYVEIFMNEELQLMGGKTTNYLLEKVRVARQAEGERNFHIFYMLSKGCDRTLRQTLELGQPEQYYYCNGGNCTTVPGINDKGDFDDVREAFKTLEFNPKDVDSIYRIVAGILHIGNVEFERVQSNYADDTSKVKNRTPLQTAAKLWQVDAAELEKGVTNKALVMPGNKTVEKGLNPEFARDQRDSLCRFVYAKIFDWLVVQINKSMEPKKKVHKSIGILDIFGFEIFQKNSLEQLCINFCNEKLQQLFNFTVFKQEEKVYQSEAIGFDHVPFIDNEPILNMIEEKPKGMMPLLDEEGKTPGGSEEKFRGKLTEAHGKNQYFKDYGKDTMAFVLSHYAGDVVYDVRGFIEKNKDELDRGLLMMLDKSKEHMVRVLFPKDVGDMSAGQRKATLSLQFRNQLNTLMKTLHSTQPHYVRCIKPNDDKEPLYFVPRNCFEQLTYSGVFEAVKIRKAGFPFRLKHAEFADRYRCILEEAGRNCGTGKTGCADIMKFLNINRENMREGKTMMLYRAAEHNLLELKRSIIMEKRKMNETLQELVNTDPNSLDEPELFFERLARTVRACRRYNITSPLAEKARKLLAQYVESRIDPETKQLLEEAIAEKNIEKLEAVCEIIEREQYETEKCMLALRMRDRIRSIIRESEKAVTTLETNHMEACLFAAQELGYTNQYIEYFQWMFETLGKDTDKFVQEQLRQAVRTQDLKRQTRLNIKLKDIFFDKMGASFGMQNCPVLKGADDWASEKFFGRDKLKEGYLVWSTEPIHSQLTTIDKKYKKDAQDIFKNLQIYMMDRPAEVGNPDNAGLEILLKGHAEPDLRNEIYCQLIKQLTNNPKNQSITRGWNAMILCLYTFPPTQELENYLEVFIRNQPQERRDRCLVALQSLMYSKTSGVKKPPTQTDMTDILNGSRPVRRDFLEEPPEVPSWASLLKSFFDESPAEEEYFDSGPELAGAVAPQPKSANNKPLSKIKRHNASIAKPPQTPAVASPKAQYNALNEETTEEKSDAPSTGGPPPVPLAALQGNKSVANVQEKKPPTTTTSTTKTTGPSSGGGNISELQAKLAQRGGPMFGNQQPKTTTPTTTTTTTTTANKGPTIPTSTTTNTKTTPTNINVKAKVDVNPKANEPKGPGGNAKKTTPPKKDASYQWLCHLDPQTGDVYYENIASGETQWERPGEPVKPYWLAHNDPDSGDMYYENIDTGETAWDKPDEFADSEEKWMARKNPETGEYYYENLATGKTQWEVPPVFQEKQPQQEWLRHFDPNSGDYYYENLRTGETTWDAPSGVKFD